MYQVDTIPRNKYLLKILGRLKLVRHVDNVENIVKLRLGITYITYYYYFTY